MINDPAQYDINVYQDRDFSNTYIIQDANGDLIDITGWTVTSQIRPAYDSDVLIANMVITTDIPTSAITTKLDDTVTKEIASTNPITAGSTVTSTNMVWDLVVDSTGPPEERFSLITGICNFYETVTRET